MSGEFGVEFEGFGEWIFQDDDPARRLQRLVERLGLFGHLFDRRGGASEERADDFRDTAVALTQLGIAICVAVQEQWESQSATSR
ncbi:hypothetical protein [Nocardia sp. NPDC057455]|uniref:hypothetical protein n=1 Tax=Nocardia sp. NPDC057455 TaxID=3346138 RepID=UPI003671DABC